MAFSDFFDSLFDSPVFNKDLHISIDDLFGHYEIDNGVDDGITITIDNTVDNFNENY